nr:uncharacterized protein LOC104114738 [Nicotiana tomentosiformis]XP_033516793.1 uncharacterized protein LOC104114738 [Nicotiana tomentosiformis]
MTFPMVLVLQDETFSEKEMQFSPKISNTSLQVERTGKEQNWMVVLPYMLVNDQSAHRRIRSILLLIMSRLCTYLVQFKVLLIICQMVPFLQEALNDPIWVKSMAEEIQALERNQAWNIVTLPEWKKPADCKCIFSIKHKPDGTIDRYKARLIARGFTQTYGVDYQEPLYLCQS